MRKLLLCATTIGLGVFGTGCSIISKPEVRDVRARIEGIDLRGVSLIFDVDVYNPYVVAIRTPGIRYGLDIADKEFIRSSRDTVVDLPAMDTGTLQLPAHIEYAGLWRAYQGLSGADEVDYRLHGSVAVKAMERSFDLPLSYRGRFPVFRLPSFSMPSAEFSDVSMSGAKVVIETEISNPNVFQLALEQLGFDVRIGDVQVGSIRPSLPDGLAAKGSGKLSLVGQITASRALMQLVSGKSLGKPMIQPVGRVGTPYGIVPLE